MHPIPSNMQIRALKRDWGNGIEIIARQRIEQASGSIKTMTISEVKLEEASELAEVRPVCILDNNAAQELMDSLWDAGIRPTNGSGSAGALAATQNHLEDMRALVRHLSKMEDQGGQFA